MAAATTTGEDEATRQKRKKKPKPKHGEVGVPSKPLPSILQTPTISPAPGTPILEEATAGAARRKRKLRKADQNLPLAEKPQPSAQPHLQLTVSAEMILQKEVMLKHHLGSTRETTSIPGHDMKPVRHETPKAEEQREGVVLASNKKHKDRKSSPLSAAEIPILKLEAKVTKKQKRRKQQDPSSNSPWPLDPGQPQPQGTIAPHASQPLPAAPFLEAPTQSPAPMLEEVAAEVALRKRKIRKEQKVVELPLAQNPTSEEQAEEHMLATMTKKKQNERNMTSLSLFAAAAAETPILEQEAKVTKKRKWSKEQEPSGYSPMPIDPRQTQPQGTKPPHASKPLPAAPFIEAAVEVAIRKRKMCKDQNVAALSLAQNTSLEEQREDAMKARMKKRYKERMSSPISMAAETTIWEQQAKVNKKQKQKPPGKSPFPLEPGQTHSQGGKAPLEQEREADGRKGSSTKKSNGKMPCVRVLSKRELIKEASKKQPVLPKGFVPFSDFVPSCTEQNPDHPPPYIAFFDQFRYKPVRGDHKPPLPRTPDRLSRLTANETHRASKSNASVASKTKQQDLGSGLQEKLNVQVKENPQKKKQRKPSGNSLPFDPTQTCCVQLQGTPEQDQEASSSEGIKQGSGKKAHVRASSKRELYKEQMLPDLSELSANGTSKANNSVARKSNKKDSDSGSASGSQEKLDAKEKKNPEKKQRKPPPLLSRADKCSDIYRRVPLDQLVPPPCSPHNLLQEKYASDPWKVIVICMLLNLTHGNQVKKIIEGFFECYPDPQSAYNADPDKMAEYLACLGLQHVKTFRVQKFSKEYVENEWSYITELCGVGKYAADAYAIFCAGRATEVVPKDHKLVDYWKYVCFELPIMQKSQKTQEAVVPEQELAVIW